MAPHLMAVYTEQISLSRSLLLSVNKLGYGNTERGTPALVVLCFNKIMKKDNVHVIKVSLLGNIKIDAQKVLSVR